MYLRHVGNPQYLSTSSRAPRLPPVLNADPSTALLLAMIVTVETVYWHFLRSHERPRTNLANGHYLGQKGILLESKIQQPTRHFETF